MKIACFFSNETVELLYKEQYSLQDIKILRDLGYDVKVATSFSEIPWGCDLYFSWWASGSILPLIKAKFQRKPIIVVAGGNEAQFTVDSVTKEKMGYLAAPWYKKLATRFTLKFCSQVLVVSKFMMKDVVSLGAKNPYIVHNSVDTNLFCIASDKREYITTIFRSDRDVVRIKRVINYISAIPEVLKHYPDQKFIIIGDKGDAYNDLMKLVDKLGLSENISFLGGMQNKDVVHWMQKSKLYIQVSDTETFGVAIAEAMSCGVPVVVSKRGAIPEVVDSLGIYVDQNNPTSISEGIISALNMKQDERDCLGLKLRQRVLDSFSYQKRRNEIAKILQ